MNDDDIARVRAIATIFRTAIEISGPKLSYITFKHFPRGACGDTCDLLAKYPVEKGIPGWNYVSGCKGDFTHAWLENEGVIVDITADQFEDNDSSVIVTRDHTWHRQFSVAQRRQPGTAHPSRSFEIELEETYQAILTAIEPDR